MPRTLATWVVASVVPLGLGALVLAGLAIAAVGALVPARRAAAARSRRCSRPSDPDTAY